MIKIESNIKFLPCPCCGEADIQWEEFNFPIGERVARKCRYCGMQTGWYKTDKEAIEQWNTRFK
jgi:Lar family restriction alleviation protein